MVARPFIHYLSEHNYNVIVASRTKAKAEKLIAGCKNAEAVAFNISKDDQLLDELVEKADLVCSLLPPMYHPKAAKIAIKHKKPFSTTSYISEEMKALNEQAKKAGILLLNECGVDPGIDHMSAMKIIDHVHNNNGKIVSFTSFTGGLPAPDSNNNPYGYKVSWTPRGVLLAGRNDAHYLKDGKEVNIKGYPNRDSMSYIDIYNIPETKTMLRGTYRNIGWCETLDAIADLGLLDIEERSFDKMTYADLMRGLTDDNDKDIKEAIAKATKLGPNSKVISRLEWLGLFDKTPIPSNVTTRLDALCHLFEEKMQYAPGERDMIVMHHEFIAEFPDKKQKITSTMIDYGIPNGDSSMSRTVAFLKELAELNISLQEHVVDL